ncbi:hypothetical protein [Haloferula sp. A504]|uniref:hypothetical protein n=1 Tax=Haloferula sp. A504 TaxID=3373601 RepID=UPI0031C1FA43|nr:hypothetical protein [Verrucomicrobiaceae bacterium E54]
MSLKPDVPQVLRDLGTIPKCWEDRSVIFFANLLSLFFGNRDGARLLSEEIRCVDSYGGRLLPVLGLIFGGSHNVLVLERTPDPALTEFFLQLGFDLPATEILTRTEFLELGRSLKDGDGADHPLLRRLGEEPAATLDGFVTDEAIARIAESLGKDTLSTPDGSHRGNNKLLLHQYLEQLGLPTFPTRLAENEREIAEALRALGGDGHRHAVIKSQIGASGIGLMKTPVGTTPRNLPKAFLHEGPCMVQGWLEPGIHGIESILSPSVQMCIGEETVHLYDLTEQILDPAASIHQGNEAHPAYLDEIPELKGELLHQAGEAARWLHRQGFRGVASTDFLVALDETGTSTVYVCEINARVTGATYPSILARHFHPHGSWRMRNLELSVAMEGRDLLDRLRNQGELFDPATQCGIIPVNFNLEADGRVSKGQFLAVSENLEECRHLLDTAREDLPVTWKYINDR